MMMAGFRLSSSDLTWYFLKEVCPSPDDHLGDDLGVASCQDSLALPGTVAVSTCVGVCFSVVEQAGYDQTAFRLPRRLARKSNPRAHLDSHMQEKPSLHCCSQNNLLDRGVMNAVHVSNAARLSKRRARWCRSDYEVCEEANVAASEV